MDEGAHRVVMGASGQDKRGQGSAKASIVSTLRQEDGVTRVDVETDFTITGRLARFGRGGMIQDISNRLLKDFADCLQQKIEAPPAAEPNPRDAGAGGDPPTTARPVGGFSLFFRALLDRFAAPSAGAEASVPLSQPGQLAHEGRVDRVRHRRLAVGHVRARPP